jgi:hypothetical protein
MKVAQFFEVRLQLPFLRPKFSDIPIRWMFLPTVCVSVVTEFEGVLSETLMQRRKYYTPRATSMVLQ